MNIKMKFLILSLPLVGIGLGGCRTDKEEPDNLNQATGTIIGSYYNGFASLLISVDTKYPIGNVVEYKETEICLELPSSGTYQNLIQVQRFEHKDGEKIHFFYRNYNPENEEDSNLFNHGVGNALCAAPNVPIYVITNHAIVKK